MAGGGAVETIVLFRQGSLGDLLMLTPALRSLRKSRPQSRIVFIVGRSNQAALENVPYIDALLSVDDLAIFSPNPLRKALVSLRLLSLIRKQRPDHLFILQHDWRWNLLSGFCGAGRTYGFDRDGGGKYLKSAVSVDGEEHETHKYHKLFSLLEGYAPDGDRMELFPSSADVEAVNRLLEEVGTGALVGMAPGGAANIKQVCEVKRWPVDLYVELVKMLVERTGVKVLLMGGPSDREITARFGADGVRVFDLAGRTNIQQSGELMGRCAAVVTHDSGPMHMASAAGAPVVAIFGPTRADEYKPLVNERGRTFWKTDSAPCVPCWNIGDYEDCGHHTCMRSVTVEEVFGEVERLLGS